MRYNHLVRKTKDAIVLALFVVLLGFTMYLVIFHKPLVHEHVVDNCLETILERDTLIAITDNSSTSYFLYKGQPMGYQYELLTHLAGHMGVALKIISAENIEESIRMLAVGEADLIAMDLTINAPRKEVLAFTIPIHETRQVLIQRIPSEEDDENDQRRASAPLIRRHAELANQTVYVQKGSAHRMRLRNLATEMGIDLQIEDSPLDSEELIALVADGEIAYTVADHHVAMANRTWFDNIDIETELSLPQEVAWATRPGSDSLLAMINQWAEEFIQSRTYRNIFRRYFVNQKAAHLRDARFHSVKGGQLSPYDDLIKKHSQDGPWDWRLVAALIYEESRFNPRARSWAGAAGLMQLMPVTARRFGVQNIYSPKEQLRGGIAFIQYLHEKLPEEITDPTERTKFILASYNIGMTHILDAYNLALKYGEDPTQWKTAEKYLLLKSQPKYYNDPVVRAGYARGRETVRFVRNVMNRYHHYRSILPD